MILAGYGPPKEKDACVKAFDNMLKSTIGNRGTYLCPFQEDFDPSMDNYSTCCPRHLISYAWDLVQMEPACQEIQKSSTPWVLESACAFGTNGPQAVISDQTRKLCYIKNGLYDC